jgi:hypothetical protein
MARPVRFRCGSCGGMAARALCVGEPPFCHACTHAIEEWMCIEGYSLGKAIQHVCDLAEDGKRGEELRPD